MSGLRTWTRSGFLVFLLGLSSCMHKATRNDQVAAPAPKEVESFHLSDPEPPEVVDQELENIPPEVMTLVNRWIDYFQGKGRPHMERYLSRSTRYSQLMKRILRQNGLPEDLIYIALIESGFSSRATSRAAAVGYWQFIKSTGRRYGLEVNSFVDERRDPVLSTQAAAEYFKGLYSVFGSWYLSMASYNVGENRVKREVMKYYTRNFWELARKKRFPKETINYIPKFIAARLIGRDPKKYGFTEIEYEKPIEFELIRVDKAVNLKRMAEKMKVDYEEFKLLNPKFRGEVAPQKTVTNTLELRVPAGYTQVALAAARESFVDKVEFVADAGETELYRVRSGDSLYTIARRFKTTVAWLRDVNDIKPRKKLRIGMRLQVPDRAASHKPHRMVARQRPVRKMKEDVEQAASTPELVTNSGVFYIVQPGDTLSEIADEYDSSVGELRRMNRLSRNAILRPGMKLKVPKDDGLPTDLGDSRRLLASDPSRKLASYALAAPAAELGKLSHVVRPGENLSTIAKKYGVSVQALQAANRLGRRSVLRVGSRLVIPRFPSQSSGRRTLQPRFYKDTREGRFVSSTRGLGE